MQNTLFYVLLMLIAGLGIPIMASLNASMSNRINSTFAAVIILLLIALLFAIIAMIASKTTPKDFNVSDTPWYLYFAGCFFVLYISSVTWVIPKFGVVNSIACVLLGQLIAMSLLDHFGAFGLNKYEITPTRLLGLVIMAIGVFVIVADSSQSAA